MSLHERLRLAGYRDGANASDVEELCSRHQQGVWQLSKSCRPRMHRMPSRLGLDATNRFLRTVASVVLARTG